jgi:hypothetical protein
MLVFLESGISIQWKQASAYFSLQLTLVVLYRMW